MEFRDTPEEAAFRAEVRAFIAQELPADLRAIEPEWGAFNTGRARGADPDLLRTWRRALARRRWLAPHWPPEYGGAGMDIGRQFILNEELALHRAPAAGGIGVGWAGPTIIAYGTEEQKRRFLPGIVSGEETWCQGFSEPGAGSDLASLQTRAVRDGDEYIINGQKIWTSNATRADWIHVLARTDPDAPKHRGISYFLVDMKTPGITVRPIVNMAGGAGFAETFFEVVRVPAANRVGEENRGWYVATTTLDFERSAINYPAEGRRTLEEVLQFAQEHRELLAKPGARTGFAELAIEIEVARWLAYRVAFLQAQGRIPNYEASMAKVFGTEMQQRLANFAINLLGPYGVLERESRWRQLRGFLAFKYQWQVAPTIFAGTNEIQRNIIATRGLGLPRE